MNIKDIAGMCIQNLLRRKGRTLLTVLGVFIGCCSIVVMVSLGIGMKESQEKMLSEMGDLTIIEVMPSQGGKGDIKLDDNAVNSFRTIPGVEAATQKGTMDEYSMKLYAGINNRYSCDWVSVVGLDSKELTKMGYVITSGKGISPSATLNPDGDIEVLAGQYLAYNFMDTFKPEGTNYVDRWSSMDSEGNMGEIPDPFFDILKTPLTLEIDLGEGRTIQKKLVPVGVTKEDYSKGYETSEGLIMDIASLQKIVSQLQTDVVKKTTYSTVLVKTYDIGKVEEVENQIRNMGYNTSSMESIRKPMEKEAQQKQMMLGGLGAISLFVAALGITNTMIMSISERTREIGIMKALGCYVKDIRSVFLAEAGSIGLIGGLTGCIASVIISIIINMVSAGGVSMEIFISVLTGEGEISRVSIIPLWLLGFAIFFSVLIGLCSGYYPANKAVQISAMEAIKNE